MVVGAGDVLKLENKEFSKDILKGEGFATGKNLASTKLTEKTLHRCDLVWDRVG